MKDSPGGLEEGEDEDINADAADIEAAKRVIESEQGVPAELDKDEEDDINIEDEDDDVEAA